MYEIVESSQFRKDYKRIKKRGYDLSCLQTVIDLLANDSVLEEKYSDHALKGNFNGYRECHIQSDWLLIYKKEEDLNVLTLSQTGTHSDLF